MDSIVLASRNEGENLRRTIGDLFRNSTPGTFEVIVVDDASTDGSGALDDAFPSGSGVSVLRNERHLGLIRSRALGADCARGERLVFLDAHCAVSPGWLEALGASLEGIGGRGIAVPRIHLLDRERWAIDPASLPATACTISNPFLDFNWTEVTPLEGKPCTCTLGGMAWMCTREWYERLGGLDREMVGWGGENIDLALRTWIAGGWCVVAGDAAVAHLFKEGPSTIDPTDLLFNKIRLAHTVFTRETFHAVLRNLHDQPTLTEAYERARRSLDTLAPLKARVESLRTRSEAWILDTFRLPVLEAPFYHRSSRKPAGQNPEARSRPVSRPRPLVDLAVSSRVPPGGTGHLIGELLTRTVYRHTRVVLIEGDGVADPGAGAPLIGHPRARVIRSSPSPSREEADLLALGSSGAELVVLLDERVRLPDDPHWVEKILLLFERRPRLALACPGIRLVEGAGGATEDLFEETWDGSVPGLYRTRRGRPAFAAPYQAFCPADAALFIRREAYLDLGGFDQLIRGRRERVRDLAIRAWLCGKEVFCHPILRLGLALDGSEPTWQNHPPESAVAEFDLLLPAVKYFRSRRRLESWRALLPKGDALVQQHWKAIERRREAFAGLARHDEDWLFYKFGIGETAHG